MAWTGLVLTNDGRKVLTKAQIDGEMKIKSIIVGDGTPPQNFTAQKRLVNQLYEITNIKLVQNEKGCMIIGDFPVVEYDYYFREIGILVDTDQGEKLYVYDNCGNDAQYIISSNVESLQKRLRLSLIISDVEHIEISEPSILYVDYEDFEMHTQSSDIHIIEEERNTWNKVLDKVDKVDGKGLSSNDYTDGEKEKLQRIEDEANKYVHPFNHPASMITQDSEHRFMTDAEKITWNATYEQATGYTDKAIGDLINGAPETLDTLKEVADAIQENETVVDALDAAIGTKANKAEVDTHTGNGTVHITAVERSAWNGKAAGNHSHDEVSNIMISKPIYSNATGTIIDFCQENIDTMVSVKITGNGYEGHDPIDCIYQFYNHSSGIIAHSGIANGSPLTLKVFRHGGRCKGWVVQSRMFQTLQIAVTFGVGGWCKPTFTTGAMPASGITNLTEIVPKTSYHTGRKPTYTEIGAAPTSHAFTTLTYGGGTAVNFGHVKLSDAYSSNIGGAANSIGASQIALFNAYTVLNNGKAASNHAHSYVPLYANSFNMGNSNAVEKNILLHSSGGAYTHQCKLYGGSESSTTGFGVFDSGLAGGTGVFVYNDVAHTVTIGSRCQFVSMSSATKGLKMGSAAIAYNLQDGIANPEGGYIEMRSTGIHFNASWSGTGVCLLEGQFRPLGDSAGTINLGTSAGRWKQLFATTATISTSDRNLKDHVAYLDADERYGKLFDSLKPVTYKLKNMNDEDNHDRVHMGLYAQDVELAMEEVGIDITEFAVLCKDFKEIEDEYQVENEDGIAETRTRMRKTEEIIYSLRYEELIPLLISELQKEKKKTSNLEERVSILENLILNQ